MKTVLSMGIFTIFLGACIANGTADKDEVVKSKEVPKYGILPFEIENITPETAKLIPNSYNKDLTITVRSSINNLKITELDNNQVNVPIIKNQQPISRTAVEIPVVSFDDEYENTLYTDLKAMSQQYDGIIFGHLEEEFAGDGSLLLIIRVYNKKDGKIKSFPGNAINLGTTNTKQKIKQRLGDQINHLLAEVKRYIVESPVIEKPSTSLTTVTQQSVSSSTKQQVAARQKLNTPQTTQEIEDLLGSNDVDNLLPSMKPEKSKTATSMSLKDVYKMLYEQKFYVIVPTYRDRGYHKHFNARSQAAQELGVVHRRRFENSFKKVKRTSVYVTPQSCTEKWLVSEPVPGTNGKFYDLCYDIRYLYSSNYVPDDKLDKVRCRKDGTPSWPRGRKTSILTYSEAEKEINRLRQETGNPRWKIPSIEELYVLADGHLPYAKEIKTVNVIWSSTSLPNKQNRKWVIQASLEKKWKAYPTSRYEYSPHPKLWDSSNSNLNGAVADTAILFPVYICGTQ